AGADWPEFRGPSGDGHAASSDDSKPIGLPLHWSETNNVKWKTEIPYRGWSTPVVMDGQVWMTTATEDGHDFFAICVDAETGQVRLENRSLGRVERRECARTDGEGWGFAQSSQHSLDYQRGRNSTDAQRRRQGGVWVRSTDGPRTLEGSVL